MPVLSRPDLAQGVFETMLLVDGRPVELDAHLARLETSLAELFPDHKPPALDDVPGERGPYGPLSTGTSPGGSLGRLRVTVAPGDDEALVVRTSLRKVSRGLIFPAASVALHSIVLDGGLGPHKWADRALLDDAHSRLPDDALPLVVDSDGTVLEASRANVFVVQDGVLATPAADGRVLPGITRGRVLKLAAAAGIVTSEVDLSRADLLAADEVLLTGSVRGVERVGALDGTPLAAGGEIGSRIAAELHRAWSNSRFG